MKKLYYLIVIVLISGLVLTGCSLLSNVGQVPATGQKGMPLSSTANLVALWHFDENSETTAYDSTDNSNDGMINGAGWVDGKLGKALRFDGGGDYVDFGSGVTSLITGDYTVEAWIKPASLDPGRHAVMSFSYMELGYDAGKVYFWQCYDNSWPKGYIYKSTEVLLDVTEFSHIVGVFHEDVGVDLYVDGNYIGSDTDKTGITLNIFGNTYAGQWYQASPAGAWFDGVIDEVRIWDGALTADEIFYSYNDETLHVDDDWVQWPGAYRTINEALAVAGDGDTIKVHEGTYNEGIIIIDNKNLTIIGATSKPIINPTTDTGIANAIGPTGRGWFQIHNGATVTFKNLVFDGTGNNIYTAVHYHGDSVGGTVENCDFVNIRHGIYQGRGINNYGNHVDVLDCTFTNIGRIGVFTFSPTADTLIKGCTYTGKDDSDCLDYGIEFGGGGSGTVDGCNISACTGVASVDDSTSAGILATDYYATGTVATVKNSIITGNTDGIAVGYGAADATVLTAHYNNISGNIEYGIFNVGTVEVNATYNWWGHPGGPRRPSGNSDKISGPKAADQVSENVLYHPWLSGAHSVSNIALDKAVTASATWQTHTADLAVDGDYDTSWNAGDWKPQWIEIDLGKGSTVVGLRLLPGQLPAGDTTHVVLFSNDGDVIAERTFSGYTERKQWLETWFDAPFNGVRTLRVTTTESPSWVAWFEIEVYGWQ